LLSGAREEECKRRAFAGGALRPDLAAVGLGDLARYGEPQARAAVGAGGVRPVEALEDEGQLVIRDADARVRDLERDPAVFLPQPHSDATALRRVLHGVVQEYGGGLEDASPVESGPDLVLRGDVLDGHLPFGGVACSLRRFFRDGAEVVAPDLEAGAFVAAGEGKERLDEGPHPTCFPADDADATTRPLRVFFERPLIQHPGVAAYGGERRAQLVAGVGRETPLALQGFFPAGEGGLQAREETVYRGGQTPDLVPGVGHGQPLREVALAQPRTSGGARGRLRSPTTLPSASTLW
jgi:hypothetical protein